MHPSNPCTPGSEFTSFRKRATLILFSIAALMAIIAAAMRGQSALDGFDPNANVDIRAVVVQPDGKILIGGDFTTLSPNGGAAVTRNHIARLNPDGTLDTAFNPNANDIVLCDRGAGGRQDFGGRLFHQHWRTDAQPHRPARCHVPAWQIHSTRTRTMMSVQSRCRRTARFWWAAVSRSIGGQTRNYIARLDPTTGLADSFDPNANGAVYAIAVQADGKILVGGVFSSIGGQTRNPHRPARSDDRLGRFVRPERERLCPAIALQADGKILVGGCFTQHRRTDAQPHRPARCHDRLGRFVRPERER